MLGLVKNDTIYIRL